MKIENREKPESENVYSGEKLKMRFSVFHEWKSHFEFFSCFTRRYVFDFPVILFFSFSFLTLSSDDYM